MKELIIYVSVACAMASAACAWFVAWRGGRWRHSDAARQLVSEFHGDVEGLAGRVDCAEGRLDKIETVLSHMPTKEDLERVRGEVHSTRDLLAVVRAGVERIEGFMMRGGRQ